MADIPSFNPFAAPIFAPNVESAFPPALGQVPPPTPFDAQPATPYQQQNPIEQLIQLMQHPQIAALIKQMQAGK